MFSITEQNLGGRDIDVSVANRLVEKLKHEEGVDIKSNPKAWFKLTEAVNNA